MLSGLRGNRKGQVKSFLVPILFLFILGFVSILAYTIWTEYVAGFTAAGFYTGPLAEAGNRVTFALGLYDHIIVLVMIALIVGVAVTSFRLPANPLGFIVVFVSGIFYGFISYFFNFVFSEAVSNAAFTATLAFFPRTILICTNMHWIMLITIVVGSLALWGKRPKGQFVE